MKKQYDFFILGAGLAGILLAYRLALSNKKVIIIDAKGVAEGASSTPLALANPATGRFAKKSYKSKEALDSIALILEGKEHILSSFVKKKKLIRPCFDIEIAEKTRKNVEVDNWENGSAEWLTKEEITHCFPLINESFGGLIVHNSYVFNPAAYLKYLLSEMRKYDCDVLEGINYQTTFEKDKQSWRIETETDIYTAGQLIHCTGHEMAHKKNVPGVAIKGQTISVSLNKKHSKSKEWTAFLSEYSISAQGYLCTLDQNEWVMGSTYEHRFNTTDPDESGLKYLTNKLKRISDELPYMVHLNNQWAGVRYSSPDRKPIIGTIDTEKKEHIFMGLASKGILYAHLYSKSMHDYLLYDHALPKEVTIDRYPS